MTGKNRASKKKNDTNNATEKEGRKRVAIDEIKIAKIDDDEQDISNQLIRTKKQNTILKLLLLLTSLLLFNVGIFQLFKKSWAAVLVIALFEILGILVYAKTTDITAIIGLWDDLLSMFSGKRKRKDDTQKPSP